jgi:hypothetical protein
MKVPNKYNSFIKLYIYNVTKYTIQLEGLQNKVTITLDAKDTAHNVPRFYMETFINNWRK